MKIAVFSDTFDQINGVAITYKELVKYAEKNNIQLDVFTQGEKDSVETFGTARVFRFKPALPVKFYSELYFDPILPNKKMLRKVKNGNYDIIHSSALGSLGINAIIIAKRLGIPIAAEYNTDVPKYILPRVQKTFKFLPGFMHKIISFPMEAILRKYIKTYYRKCDLVLTVSEYNKEQLEKLIHKEVAIFSRGVDITNFNPSKRKPDFKKQYQSVLALYVGRISVEKNIQILINIFKDRDDLRLILVGDGPYREEMQKRLPSAVFTGPVYDREKLAQIYSSCDFFLFPSETETFGQVITEALSSGLPVVVSDKGASHEQVTHGEDGFIYNNESELREQINFLTFNEPGRRKMGEKARASVLRHSWDSVFNRLMCQYQMLLSSRNAKRIPISSIALESNKVA